MKVIVKYMHTKKPNKEIEIEDLCDIGINYNREFIITTNEQDEDGEDITLFISMDSVRSIEIADFQH